jgi:hypothetical protein
MKTIALTYTFWMIILISITGTVKAESGMKTAMANCREEATSTGLQDEADITAYIDLCMQAWQNTSEYTESYSASDETDNPPVGTPESVAQ